MFNVNEEKCIGCSQCIKDCPVNDILLTDNKKAQIKNESCIACGHCIAICPKEAVSTDSFNMEEVQSFEADVVGLDPTRLLNTIRFRRTTRRFTEEPIEQSVLKNIIEAGRFTQTGTNSQDVSYIVLSDTLSDVKDTIYEILKKKGEYLLANLTPETKHLEAYANLWVHMYDAYHADKKGHDRLFFNAPAVILLTANSPVNGALATGNMDLMANAYGLGTCICGFALVALNDQPELLKQIGVEEGKSIVTCLVIGHPNVTYKRTVPRKQADVKWK